MNTFEIVGDDFVLRGEPFRVLSGAIHYFRVHPDHWADRIRKAREMGLNTIETYVPWNLHEPKRGEWDADGRLDLGRFLRIIAAEGMYAIVRPGPYICAEWDNGGLPGWLTSDPDVGLRRSEPLFMAAVSEYLRRVYRLLEPLQIGAGGPLILVQIENEYGAYGDDKAYLRALVEITRAAGIDVPLTTVDQPEEEMLEAGSLPDILATGSFGSRARERLRALRRHQPAGPLMCAEFWNGWFDHWGAHHHTTSVEASAAELDELLSSGASVNLYMFHGGTNFGFTNGANDKGTYQALVTSYDYDAPLDEAGQPTAKYWAFKDVIAKHSSVPEITPEQPVPAPQKTIPLVEKVSLLSISSRAGRSQWFKSLPSFDDVCAFNGFALYSTDVTISEPSILEFAEVRDHATVFLGKTQVGVLSRDHHARALTIPASGRLTILVEDQGRVNYGQRLGEAKGLIGPALLASRPLTGWTIMPVDFDLLVEAADMHGWSPVAEGGRAGPGLARGSFFVEEPADHFLDTSSWGKGVVWINDFCLGRFWSRGPQHTLYIPAPVLRRGVNEIRVFETATAVANEARFVPHANLGQVEF